MARSNFRDLLLQCDRHFQEEITSLSKQIERAQQPVYGIVQPPSKYQIEVMKDKLKKLKVLKRDVHKSLREV